ncbi:MAG TPA: hypothetical protein V6C65_20085, partial [Allocoleopsis sp.]
GVHHLLYYPLETIDTKVTLTNGSALVTVTEGTTPDTWAVGYKGIVFLPSGSLDTKVYLIDRTKTISDTQFYLTEVWTGDTEEAVVLRIAPEADLKVLAKETTEFCIVSEIGKMGASCSCDDGKEYDLMRLLMWLFAAQVNFDCKDYSAAHNKVVAAYMECTNCKKPCLCS